jgi:hypothetical protein
MVRATISQPEHEALRTLLTGKRWGLHLYCSRTECKCDREFRPAIMLVGYRPYPVDFTSHSKYTVS